MAAFMFQIRKQTPNLCLKLKTPKLIFGESLSTKKFRHNEPAFLTVGSKKKNKIKNK
jgi:hypothetical protein